MKLSWLIMTVLSPRAFKNYLSQLPSLHLVAAMLCNVFLPGVICTPKFPGPSVATGPQMSQQWDIRAPQNLSPAPGVMNVDGLPSPTSQVSCHNYCKFS